MRQPRAEPASLLHAELRVGVGAEGPVVGGRAGSRFAWGALELGFRAQVWRGFRTASSWIMGTCFPKCPGRSTDSMGRGKTLVPGSS